MSDNEADSNSLTKHLKDNENNLCEQTFMYNDFVYHFILSKEKKYWGDC